jgi:osmotically-inducible protein OsmY
MVRVAATTSDHITAWRIRDSLASHPLLGGATADIDVIADHAGVVLQGWAIDHAVHDLALKMALRAAGRRTVFTQVTVQDCRTVHSVTRDR